TILLSTASMSVGSISGNTKPQTSIPYCRKRERTTDRYFQRFDAYEDFAGGVFHAARRSLTACGRCVGGCFYSVSLSAENDCSPRQICAVWAGTTANRNFIVVDPPVRGNHQTEAG